jgi:hypothetical protein
MNFIKEHWEVLTGFAGSFFGFGGIYVQHKDHGRRIGKLEENELERAKKHEADMLEVKTGISTLLERTKNL